MMMYVNLAQALELLAYLGFAVGRAGGIQASLRVTRDRRIDIAEKSTDRKVFQCLLIGGKDAGKVSVKRLKKTSYRRSSCSRLLDEALWKCMQ